MKEEQYDNPTDLDDVMHELRQLRIAVQELTQIVQQRRQNGQDVKLLINPNPFGIRGEK